MSQMDPENRKIWSCRLTPAPKDECRELERLLRGKELSLWDDAAALSRFLRLRGLSQAEGARVLGRSQAAVANRLRLLQLTEDVREALRASGATERHARALLRIRDPEDRRRAAAVVVRRGLTVAETEDFVEALLSPEGAAAALMHQQREALNELWGHLEEIKARCPELETEIRSREGCVEILLRFPRK